MKLQGLIEEEFSGHEDEDLSQAILEMLHINKLSVPQRTKPHPYMKLVYKFLDSKDASAFSSSEGTLVQSFRSIHDLKYRTPGWIWFNVSHLKPPMAIAELVLLRKTLHPQPLSVSIAVHSIFCNADHLTVSDPIEEKVLSLDEAPPSGRSWAALKELPWFLTACRDSAATLPGNNSYFSCWPRRPTLRSTADITSATLTSTLSVWTTGYYNLLGFMHPFAGVSVMFQHQFNMLRKTQRRDIKEMKQLLGLSVSHNSYHH